MDGATAEKLQKKLKASLRAGDAGREARGVEAAGVSLADLLAKYDKSGDGMLNQQELTTLIRKDLKVRSRDVSDKEIASLVAALDDDGDGTLSTDELALRHRELAAHRGRASRVRISVGI